MTPQEQQALYEAYIDKIATAMAQRDDPYGYRMLTEVEYSQEAFEGFMSKYKPLAEIALKQIKEEVKEMWEKIQYWAPYDFGDVNKYLQSRGIIPKETK